MTVRTPSYLKSVFESGDTPSGTDFSDVFDSFLPLLTTAKQRFDFSLEVSGDVTAKDAWFDTVHASAFQVGTFVADVVSASVFNGNIFNGNRFNGVVVSASTMNTNQLNAQIVSASTINGGTGNFDLVSASTINSNMINAQVVSASIGNLNILNAQVVSASVGRFSTVSAVTLDAPYVLQSVQNVSASGTVESQGNLVSAAYAVVIDASANAKVIKLETFRRGFRQTIINDTAVNVVVYPPNGLIDDASSLTVAASATKSIVHITATQYYSGA